MGAKPQGPLLDHGQDPGATTEKAGSNREHLCKQPWINGTLGIYPALSKITDKIFK